MEKPLDQMTRDELDKEMYGFIANATPENLSLCIQEFEGRNGYEISGFIPFLKATAFSKMLRILNASTYTSERVRGNRTTLHINMKINDICLLITKKDKQSTVPVYAKLYDKHKDELLRIIESKKEETSLAESREFAAVNS